MSESFTGHCLCGAVSWRAEGPPLWAGFCHCIDCRRATGAPVAAYAGFPQDRVRFTGAAPAAAATSPGVTRRFCGQCGSPLSYENTRWPGQIHLMLGTADQAQAFAPQLHVYTSQQIPWLHLADGLPRHPRFPSEDAG